MCAQDTSEGGAETETSAVILHYKLYFLLLLIILRISYL